MRVLFGVGVLSLLTGQLASSDLGTTEAEYIAAGKHASVHRLDPTLPNVPLERWLQRLVGSKSKLAWESNDCGEATGSPADSGQDFPVCVEATAQVRDVTVSVSIQMGTMDLGLVGEPGFWWAVIEEGDSTEWCASLSALSRSLERRHPSH